MSKATVGAVLGRSSLYVTLNLSVGFLIEINGRYKLNSLHIFIWLNLFIKSLVLELLLVSSKLEEEKNDKGSIYKCD